MLYRSRRTLALLAGGMMFTGAAQGDIVWQLYDLRDLRAVLPKLGPVPGGPMQTLRGSPIPSATELMFGESDPAAPAEARDPLDELMGRLCSTLQGSYTMLFPGVYGVEAEEEEQAWLTDMLVRIRDLYAERYQVELVCTRVPTSDAPAVGDRVSRDEGSSEAASLTIFRQATVVLRRDPTPMRSVVEHLYLANLIPQVAENAVGYGAETESIDSGVNLIILVGAGKDEAQGTPLRIEGAITQVEIGRQSGTFGETSHLPLDLPAVMVRVIRSDQRIAYGEPRVLCVVDGFEPDESIVVVATVSKVVN